MWCCYHHSQVCLDLNEACSQDNSPLLKRKSFFFFYSSYHIRRGGKNPIQFGNRHLRGRYIQHKASHISVRLHSNRSSVNIILHIWFKIVVFFFFFIHIYKIMCKPMGNFAENLNEANVSYPPELTLYCLRCIFYRSLWILNGNINLKEVMVFLFFHFFPIHFLERCISVVIHMYACYSK